MEKLTKEQEDEMREALVSYGCEYKGYLQGEFEEEVIDAWEMENVGWTVN